MRIGPPIRVLLLLGFAAGAASCQSTSERTNEAVLQTVEELRAEVAVLKRTVARLEQELAEVKKGAAATPAVNAQSAPARQSKSQKVQCAGMTQAGARCKRSAKPGSRYCWQHAR